MSKLGFVNADKAFEAGKKARAKARKQLKKESGKSYKNIFKA